MNRQINFPKLDCLFDSCIEINRSLFFLLGEPHSSNFKAGIGTENNRALRIECECSRLRRSLYRFSSFSTFSFRSSLQVFLLFCLISYSPFSELFRKERNFPEIFFEPIYYFWFICIAINLFPKEKFKP